MDNRQEPPRAKRRATGKANSPSVRQAILPVSIEIDRLQRNPYYSRREDPQSNSRLSSLLDSINRYGFLGAIVARRHPNGKPDTFQIVDGHRRAVAARYRGYREIPVVVVDLSDDELQSVALASQLTVLPLTMDQQILAVVTLQETTGWSRYNIARAICCHAKWLQYRDPSQESPMEPVEPWHRDES